MAGEICESNYVWDDERSWTFFLSKKSRLEDTYIEMILEQVNQISQKYCIEGSKELQVVEHYPYRFAILSEYAKYCVYSILALENSDELLELFDRSISYRITLYLDKYYDEKRVIEIMDDINTMTHLIHDGIYDCKTDKNFYYHQLVYAVVDQGEKYREFGDSGYDDDLVVKIHDINIESINEILHISTVIANEWKEI